MSLRNGEYEDLYNSKECEDAMIIEQKMGFLL